MPERSLPRCTRPEIFWGEIAPREHFVQLYQTDDAFLNALEAFVWSGLKNGEAVVVIATALHREGLRERLKARGCDLSALRIADQYIDLDAEETLSQFMVRGWPDTLLFNATIRAVISRAQVGHRRVRAFGEMVALLWSRGENGATVHLEHLWNEFMQSGSFSLFCAYPKSGFTENSLCSLDQICAAHSKLIDFEESLLQAQ